MQTWAVPAFLHDVFGERASPKEIVAILGFGVGAALWLSGGLSLAHLPWWRAALAWLLVMDIAAGCVANFTRGTSEYYAARPKHRWVFLAVHVHLMVVCWLLGAPLAPALGVWAYTIVGAAVVNLLSEAKSQTFVAGSLLALGVLWVPQISGVSGALEAVFLLFLVKVLYSFSVDHYASGRHAEPLVDGVRELGPADEASFVSLIKAAFAHDPLFVSLFGTLSTDPAQARRREAFVCALFRMNRTLGGRTRGLFQNERLVGAYLLEPPARGVVARLRQAFAALHFLPVWRALGKEAISFLNRYMLQTRGAAPTEPHHYLSLIGVAPEAQGKGLGRRLLEDASAEAAQSSNAGVALDTENPDNVALYTRWGFSLRASLPMKGFTAHVMFRPRG